MCFFKDEMFVLSSFHNRPHLIRLGSELELFLFFFLFCVWRGTAKQRASVEKQPCIFTLRTCQTCRVSSCAGYCVFFSDLKAKYERYQAHICFYGSLGSHIHILRHDLAQRREKGERERGFDVKHRAWSCFDHISALCSALQYNPGCVMWFER